MTLISNRPSGTESAPESHVVVATGARGLADRIAGVLEQAGTTVSIVQAPAELDAFHIPPDLLVLDAATAPFGTRQPLVRLRQRWPSLLVVVLSVPGEKAVVELLDAGADDAIDASAAWPAVVARLRAAGRRTRVANALLRRRVGDVVYDRENRRVWCAGVEVEFAPRELAVLDALWTRAGELVRHESLQGFVWSGTEEGEHSNRLEVYISYIRRKLQRSNEVTIQTLRGAGYRLVHKSATDSPWERSQ